MKTPIRRRQLRGLVLHHRRHPADHPRRLINRTASWGEAPRNGICRWCYELTASPRTRWHLYCLNAYRLHLVNILTRYSARSVRYAVIRTTRSTTGWESRWRGR